MNKPQVYNLIVTTLRNQDMTAAELAAALSLPAKRIANSIQAARQSTKNTPIYVARRAAGKPVYSLTPPLVSLPSKSSRNVNPRYVPPFREITPQEHDMWQHKNLALLAR